MGATCTHCCGTGGHGSAGHNGLLDWRTAARLAMSTILLSAAYLPTFSAVARNTLLLIAYLITSYDVLLFAAGNVVKGRVFDENFLMSIASLGAVFIGQAAEGVAVMLFYQVGEMLQGVAVQKSRRSIQALIDIRPDQAAFLGESGVVMRAAEEIEPGDLILIKPGERIPLDAVVVEGLSRLDTSALTGESMPRDVGPEDQILSGCINLSGVLTARVTKPFGESTASKILELVENAATNKAKSERFITKFARYYTPVVVGIALLLAVIPPLVTGGDWGAYLRRALVFLVISCPCALVLSVPVAFFAGIGRASRDGILIKGGNYLEALRKVDIMVFDKTGTLTKGSFQVTGVHAEQMTKEEVLEYAACAEAYSDHPIAASIRAARQGGAPDKNRIGESEEIPGGGIRTLVDGRVVLLGNKRMMQNYGVSVPAHEPGRTPIYLAVDGSYCGTIFIGDTSKPEAAAVLRNLKKLGVRRTVMLTGDHKEAGERIGGEVGVDEVHAELLPADKVYLLEKLLKEKACKGNLVYTGDGINDAPSLARADVGVAMGGLGTDAAMEAADVVIMDDSLERLPQAVELARRTGAIVIQNIILVLALKSIFLILGAVGLAGMWEAVFADVGVSLLAVLNSMRVLGTVRRRKYI